MTARSRLYLLLMVVAASASVTAWCPAKVVIPKALSLHASLNVHAMHQRTPSTLHLSNNNSNEEDVTRNKILTFYTPLDRPLLAIVDTIALIIFAAIGKSSHSADGSLDILAVLSTAFPFIVAWLGTSPVTGVYASDEQLAEGILGGWLLAIPLGIALRGIIKGYIPPTPFMIVTLVSTLVILQGCRLLFTFVEGFFVEMV